MVKKNYWKTATIVLAIIACLLVMFNIYQDSQIYDFGKFEISKKQFNSLVSSVKTNEPFRLCSLEDNQCVQLQKIENPQNP